MRFIQIPIAGTDALSKENVERLDAALRDGLDEGPVLLHCASGNRIGAMLALHAAWIGGADSGEALRFGLDHGMTSLEPAVRELLRLPPAG